MEEITEREKKLPKYQNIKGAPGSFTASGIRFVSFCVVIRGLHFLIGLSLLKSVPNQGPLNSRWLV